MIAQCPPHWAQTDSDDVEDSAPCPTRHFLFEGGGGDALLAPDFPAIRGDGAVQKFKQGGFADTVSAQQADAVALVDLKAGPFDKVGAAEAPADLFQGNQRHGDVLCWRCGFIGRFIAGVVSEGSNGRRLS
jgi:hypothetical protein